MVNQTSWDLIKPSSYCSNERTDKKGLTSHNRWVIMEGWLIIWKSERKVVCQKERINLKLSDVWEYMDFAPAWRLQMVARSWSAADLRVVINWHLKPTSTSNECAGNHFWVWFACLLEPGYCVKRRFRLKASQEIRKIRQAGLSYSNPLVVLITSPNLGTKTKLAVIASRSVGGAVQRNRCKRLIRAGLNPFLNQIEEGHNILLIARSQLLNAKFEEIEQAIFSLLVKSKLIKVVEDVG